MRHAKHGDPRSRTDRLRRGSPRAGVGALCGGALGKYRLPGDTGPRLEGTDAYRARAPRGPTLRSLVKPALRCQSAEEMGLKLRRRFDRSLRCRGIDPNRERQRQAEAELDRLLGQD